MKYLFAKGMRVLLYLVSLLPWWLLFKISNLLYYILLYVVRYRKNVVEENLAKSFPEKTAQERELIKKNFYRYLADLLVESLKLFSVSPTEAAERVKMINPDLIKSYFADGKSVIGVLGHYGNWEMTALSFSLLFEQPRIIVYKPLSNPVADETVKKLRSRFGATLVPMKQIARQLISLKKTRTMTVLVSDQTPPQAQTQHFAQFLNQPTAVFLGVEKLAIATDSVIVFCDIRRIGRGQYQCTFVPLFDNPRATEPYQITDGHVGYLEKVIREKPEYWLWSHRRWKFKPTA